jgi:hypothetical protein
LVGGRWGGRFDVLVRVHPTQPRDASNRAILQAADPDYVEAKDSFLYQPEVELHGPNNQREIDAIALLDGGLVLAEAKSNNELAAAEVNWCVYAARRSRASEVLFATTSLSRPLCAALECDRCRAENGEHHRDYAWSDGSRIRVSGARQQLVQPGTRVRTLCFESLVAAHGDATEELKPFRR